MTPRLHCDIHRGAGPPLLLVHGFMSSRAQWLANLPGMMAFCSPVVVELWGHGRSPMPDDPALNARGQKMRAVLDRGVPLRGLPLHPAHGKRLPADVKAALTHDADQLDLGALARSVAITRTELSVRDRFAETRVPTLLLNGIYEKSFQPTAKFAKARLPAMVTVELEGGHAVNAEAALPFNAAVKAHFQCLHGVIRSGNCASQTGWERQLSRRAPPTSLFFKYPRGEAKPGGSAPNQTMEIARPRGRQSNWLCCQHLSVAGRSNISIST